MTSFFNFAAQPVEVEIKLTGEAERKQVEVKGEKDKKEMCPVYYDGESVVGQVSYPCILKCKAVKPALPYEKRTLQGGKVEISLIRL